MYDVIVVGARCAGSPTAMLLARKGYRVLLVDRSTFPSDIMSTHYIHPPGIAQLQGWGLIDRLRATNCPPISKLTLYFGGKDITPPAPPGGEAYCPRRTVLDKLLIDAASEAGAEVCESFTVDEVLMDGERVTGIAGHARGGAVVSERAKLVVGADGMHSVVARSVDAPRYRERESLSCAYYTYWSGVELAGAEIHLGDAGGVLAFPTNDGMAVIAAGAPHEIFDSFRKDIEGHYFTILDVAPELAARVRDGTREERFQGTGDVPNFFRRPSGPGWALVGDAGYHKDPVTGFGIMDAFRDSQLIADAIDEGLSGNRAIDQALASYEQRRNEAAFPLYDFTVAVASGEMEMFSLGGTRTVMEQAAAPSASE